MPRAIRSHPSGAVTAARIKVFKHKGRSEPQGSQSILPWYPCDSLRSLCLKTLVPAVWPVTMSVVSAETHAVETEYASRVD